MPNARIHPVILLSPVEGGYVAYDPALDRLHQLNPVAALLTELCDGSRSVEEIRDLAGPLMPEGKIGEIDRWIDDGIKAGLLVWEGGAAAGGRELSAEELATLTKRLKATGKFQSAYLCGKRTVELAPDDSDAWYELGEVAQCVGRRDEARAAYQKYFDTNPEDGEIEHLLIALRDDAPPPRASDRAIQHIYKSFAASYESRMREDLRYVGPERMQDALQAVIADRTGLSILDLGCGSGLAGVSMRPRAAEMVGMKYVDGKLAENPNAKWRIDLATRSMLQRDITAAFAGNTPLSDLAATIRASGAFDQARADLIATTEVSNAQMRGNAEAWLKNGNVQEFKWQLSADHVCCDECDIMAINSPYPVEKVLELLDQRHPRWQCAVSGTKIKGVDL